MSFAGMDLDAVLKHARALEVGAANEIFNVLTAMQAIMPQLMDAWKGEDAIKFNADWAHHHTMLTQLHGTLTGIAESVAAAARTQAETSGH